MEETVKTEVVNNTTQNKGNKNFSRQRTPRKEFKKNFEPKKKLLARKSYFYHSWLLRLLKVVVILDLLLLW